MNKETFKKEWGNLNKEPALEFPSGEYYYIDYNEADDRLEYGICTNTGFKPIGGIDCDYSFGLDNHIEKLYNDMIQEMPELMGKNE